MAAAPFTGTLRCRKADGSPISYRFAASDVAGAAVTWTDLGGRASIVTPPGGLVIVDLTLSAAGTDTSALQVRRGITDKPIFLDNSLLSSTSIERSTRLQDLHGAVLAGGEEYALFQRA